MSKAIIHRSKNKRVHIQKEKNVYAINIFDLKGNEPCVKFLNPKYNYRINGMILTEETIEIIYFGMLKLKQQHEQETTKESNC